MENNSNNTVIISIVTIVLIVLAGAGGFWIGSSQGAGQMSQDQISGGAPSTKAVALTRTMDKLWEDHIIYTREYIIAAANNLPEKDQVLARLMKNQEDIGNAAKGYYGDAAGNQLTGLLKAHIAGAGELLSAAIAKDNAKVTSAKAAWQDNANQIADLLAQANPNWPQADMRKMMADHLDLTFQEAGDIINKNSAASIADFDKVHTEILQMSAMLSDGIIKQFPDKF